MTKLSDEGVRTISPIEAANQFGDLARIRNGQTIWLEVETVEGVWRPFFNLSHMLVGYELAPFIRRVSLSTDVGEGL